MKKILKELIPYLIIIVVVLFIKTFIVSPVRVIGDSMKDTLFDGDIMILDKLTYRFKDIKRFDIIVINHNKTHIIKRVIGLPGDTIKYENNKLYINDKYYEEKYLSTGTSTPSFTLENILKEEKVPNGCYFVLGDNREVSSDSRIIGFIDKKDIEGHARLTIFPFKRFGVKN